MSSGVANEKEINSLKALAEPIRLEIIESLSSGEKCVCDLIIYLKLMNNLVHKLLSPWLLTAKTFPTSGI